MISAGSRIFSLSFFPVWRFVSPLPAGYMSNSTGLARFSSDSPSVLISSTFFLYSISIPCRPCPCPCPGSCHPSSDIATVLTRPTWHCLYCSTTVSSRLSPDSDVTASRCDACAKTPDGRTGPASADFISTVQPDVNVLVIIIHAVLYTASMFTKCKEANTPGQNKRGLVVCVSRLQTSPIYLPILCSPSSHIKFFVYPRIASMLLLAIC